jgi:hypothetical protein
VKLFNLFLMTPKQGAQCSLYVATAPELGATSGEYFERSKPKAPARAALDVGAQERLWALSEALLKLAPSGSRA